MKCITGHCDKENHLLSLDEDNAIVPFECDIGYLREIFTYFQYRAPNIDSLQSPLLDVGVHDQVLGDILNGNQDFRFVSQNSNTEEQLTQSALLGPLICTRCKRFLCKRSTSASKRDTSRRETDLECLLRHMRNALAHGHVFIFHGGNYITVCFEDRNKTNRVTARILCNQADLRRWKEKLERAVANQNR